jgi:hypothetical protein
MFRDSKVVRDLVCGIRLGCATLLGGVGIGTGDSLLGFLYARSYCPADVLGFAIGSHGWEKPCGVTHRLRLSCAEFFSSGIARGGSL